MGEIDDKALEAYIRSAAVALGISLEDAWMPSIRANLAVSLRLADEAEPAPVFEA